MPIAEAGFQGPAGGPDPLALIRQGPTLQVVVSRAPVSPQGAPPSGLAVGQPVQSPPASPMMRVVQGLVDTGAVESCIDSALALAMQLPVVDRVLVSGAAGPSLHDVYAAIVLVPSLGIPIAGRFAGVHLKRGNQQHEVLLGRTFLQSTVMVYDGRRGHVMLASASMLGGAFAFAFPSTTFPQPGGTPLSAAIPPGLPASSDPSSSADSGATPDGEPGV